MSIKASVPFTEFLERNKSNPGCWNWTKARGHDGYGRTKINGKTTIAHRAAFRIINKQYKKGIPLLHSCDNPACCNPLHLRFGTPKENYEDSRQRGRNSCGERNGLSKLKESDVRQIRASDKPLRIIGEFYGIRWQYVWMIKQKRSWKHVN